MDDINAMEMDFIDLDNTFECDDKYNAPGDDGGSVASKGDLTTDHLQALINQMKGEQFKVCTKEQQMLWVKTKTECQIKLVEYLLEFESVILSLRQLCDEGLKNIVGRIVVDGADYKVDHDKKIYTTEIINLIDSYLANKTQKNKQNLIDCATKKYVLSYAHFVKVEANRIWKKYSKIRDDINDSFEFIELNQTLDLFPVQPEIVKQFENSENLSWQTIKDNQRVCYLLTKRINNVKNNLVTTNMRGVIKNARSYYYRMGGESLNSLTMMDLIPEGVEGLMHAADLYVYSEDCDTKFNSYAENWVKLRISRHIQNGKTVRLPLYITERVNKIIEIFRKHDIGGVKHNMLTMAETQAMVDFNISEEIWMITMNRYLGVSSNIYCSSSSKNDDDSEFDFDWFVNSEGFEQQEEDKLFFSKCMTIAKQVLTPIQYMILKLVYIDDKDNDFIANFVGHDCRSNYIRSQIKQAESTLKKSIKI